MAEYSFSSFLDNVVLPEPGNPQTIINLDPVFISFLKDVLSGESDEDPSRHESTGEDEKKDASTARPSPWMAFRVPTKGTTEAMICAK